MGISDNVKAEIKNRLDIVEVIGEYVTLKREGPRYVGLCPFHNEKTPSFKVTPEKGVYYCFGCQAKGDIFSFIMEIEKMTFPESMTLLAKKAGVEISYERRDNRQKEALLELYRKVAGAFHYLLLQSPEGKAGTQYLADRKIEPQTIEKYQIGYAPRNRRWLGAFLERKGYSREFLNESGLFTRGKLDALFWNRVMFPILNTRGEVVAFGGRTLDPKAARYKYVNSPETLAFRKRENLYGIYNGLSAIKEQKEFFLVEGYMDVVAMSQMGFDNCVAPLGTAVAEAQLRLLKRYGVRGILLFDGDDAGTRAARRSIELFEGLDMPCKIAVLPRGKDPADIMRSDGPASIDDLAARSVGGFQLLLEKALTDNDTTNPTGKQAIVSELTPFLRSVSSSVRREGYFQLLAEALDVSAQAVERDFLTGSRSTHNPQSAQTPKSELTVDLFLMIAIAANLDYFSEIRLSLDCNDLEDQRARLLYLSMEDCFRKENLGLDCVLEDLADESLKTLLLEKISSDEFSINQELLVFDAMRQIKSRALREQRRQVASLLRKSERDEPWRTKDLLEEIMVIDGQIEELKVTRNVRYSE